MQCRAMSNKPALHADGMLRLRGGGGDGGSTGAESRSCYLEMYRGKRDEKVDPAQQRHARWTQCSFSGRPLLPPIVADEGGALYNRQDLVPGLAAKAAGGPWPEGLAHIRLKELLAVFPDMNRDAQRCVTRCKSGLYLRSALLCVRQRHTIAPLATT